jgi:hypothetical protein
MFILPIQFSDPRLPEGWRPEIPSPFILPRSQGKIPGASLFYDAVPETQTISGQRAAYLIKQQVPVRYWLLCLFPPFYVVTEPRHAT